MKFQHEMKHFCSRPALLLTVLAWTLSFAFLIHTHSFYRAVLTGVAQPAQFTFISHSLDLGHHFNFQNPGEDLFYDKIYNPGNEIDAETASSGTSPLMKTEMKAEEADVGSEVSPERRVAEEEEENEIEEGQQHVVVSRANQRCATVEEMGSSVTVHTEDASLGLKKKIDQHFKIYGATRIRGLEPKQFCKQNFVFGRSSEAGFGNEMYRILTAAALSVLLNRSLIIGERREHLPFGDYLAYSEEAFSLREIRLLWVKNQCSVKYKRPLVMRIDDFKAPTRSAILCEDWRLWKQPIVWLKNPTDGVAIQFFLKNIHYGLRNAAYDLIGDPMVLSSRPNLFGYLMNFMIHPKTQVEEAVNWTLNGGPDPDITLHMRMLSKRSVYSLRAAINCAHKALKGFLNKNVRPRVLLVTDTPSIISIIRDHLKNVAEVVHFDYRSYIKKNGSGIMNATVFQPSRTRAQDWGPMPRWVAFVDFFLASRARHAVISGANKRVGTTYAQLLAAKAAATLLDEDPLKPLNLTFYSSFQRNNLKSGLANQIGWGHAWNRFAGQFSCRNQSDQCALTPLLPFGWWDGPLQSPIERDIRRLKNFGVTIDEKGTVSEQKLISFCRSRKVPIDTLALQLPSCKHCSKN